MFHYCTSAKHILPVIDTAVWNGLFSLFECNPVTNAPITNYRWCHCAEIAFCSSCSFWHHASSYHMIRSSQRRSIKTEWQKKKKNAIFSYLAVLLWRGQHCEVLDLQTASQVLCTFSFKGLMQLFTVLQPFQKTVTWLKDAGFILSQEVFER